jgi:hypothetical protein
MTATQQLHVQGRAAFVPKTLRFCPTCERDTPHKLLAREGAVVKLCIYCLDRAMLYELDRD